MANKLDALEAALRTLIDAASDDPSLPEDVEDYMLFLGWYSDPPGETFWEGRRLADFAYAQELVSRWVLQGAAPEALLIAGRLA